jgi:hypothetical protein
VLASLNRLGTLDSADQLRKLYAAASPLFTSPASPESTVRLILDDVWGAWLGGTLGVPQSSQGAPLQRVLLRASYLYDRCKPVAEQGVFFRGVETLMFAMSTGLFQPDGRTKFVDQYLDMLVDQDGAHRLQEQDAVFRFQARCGHE